MTSPKDDLIARIISKFNVAFTGLIYGIKHDKSIQIHVVLALIASAVAFILNLSVIEWAIWLICIALVLGFEYLNSSLEQILDYVQPSFHPLIKISKDLAAASVLIMSILSLMIAILFIVNRLM
jgi:diacylglycerol kinase